MSDQLDINARVVEMWDSVIVGAGNKGCSACKVFAIEGNHSISENNVSYWIGDMYLGLGLTVFKYTEEGARITQMINDREGIEKISAFLEDVLLRNINRDKLKSAIDKAINCGFNAGCASKAEEMRHVLGL